MYRRKAARTCLGDGTPGGADRPAVQLAHGHDLGAGAGEEDLVGRPGVGDGQLGLHDLDALLARQVDDEPAGDAGQRAVRDRRGAHAAARDEEHVVGRALRDQALRVQQQRLVGALPAALDRGQHRGEVVERLHLRRQRVGGRPAQARRDDHDAVAVGLLGIDRERCGDHHHRRARTRVGRDAERADAAGDDEADVAVGEAGAVDASVTTAAVSARASGRSRASARAEASSRRQVGVEQEGLAAVEADPLEDAVAVEEAVVENRDPRLVARAPDSIHVGDHLPSPPVAINCLVTIGDKLSPCPPIRPIAPSPPPSTRSAIAGRC